LRGEWAFWRKTAKKYGFGRTELMPVKSTAEGIGRYVGKYISKNIEARNGTKKDIDKGVRLVRYSKDVRAGTTRFMFVSEGSRKWRAKVKTFAEIVMQINGEIIDDVDDLSSVCGKKWAYYNRDFILSLPEI